jgi:hypothetical protein
MAEVEQPREASIVSVAHARTHGWTISITSSSHTEEDLQVEVQQHLESEGSHVQPLRPQWVIDSSKPEEGSIQRPPQKHRELQHWTIEASTTEPTSSTQRPSHQQQQWVIDDPPIQAPPQTQVQPRLPTSIVPPIPTLSRDRVVVTEEDISSLRIKCISVLILGIILPPLWLLMGWGHTLDGIFLPLGRHTTQREICDVYKSYRQIASVLSGVAVLATFSGVVIGGLALGGVL